MKIKKKQIVILLTLLFIVLCTAWGVFAAEGGGKTPAHDGIIRFHVIANSDSEQDQTLKLAVRDQVLEELNGKLIRETMARHDREDENATLTIEESREYIQENLSAIKEVAENVIREHGFDYKAKAELGECWIPQKTYGEVIYPAGNYEALNITIGEGNGENWWCVLFPPLCLIDTQESSGGGIEIDGIDLTAGPAMKATEGGITLRFKTVEIIDSLKKD